MSDADLEGEIPHASALFEGDSIWVCPDSDCDGIVDGDGDMDHGRRIDGHLAKHHDTTLQAYAAEGKDALD